MQTLEGLLSQNGPYLAMLEAELDQTPSIYKGIPVTFSEQR